MGGMTLVLTILVLLGVLSFLVLIHEFGHMIAAKIFGVSVEEFGIGYPPRAVKLFRKWKTDFTLNWLPFGGFVRMLGEERGGELQGVAAAGQFYSKRKWQRMVIILAGAATNFVFGAVAFSVVYTLVGIPTNMPGVAVARVYQGSPAEQAGVMVGDIVESVKVEGQELAVGDVGGFVQLVGENLGKRAELVLSGESARNVSVYVRTKEETPEGEGALGVAIAPNIQMARYPVWQMPFRGMVVGIKAAVGFGILIVGALYKMVHDLLVAGVVPAEVAGPVGIVYQASKQEILKEGPVAVIHLAGVLSINLAIVNVLPLPALDGGRAMFVFLEKFLGKRFKPIYENWANMVGFGLLLLLIVLVSLRDTGVILSDRGINWGSITKIFGK